jgi:hypothetical protein
MIHLPRLAGLALAFAAAVGAYWFNDVRSDTSQKASRDRASAPSSQLGTSRPLAPPASGAGQTLRVTGTSAQPSRLSNTSAPANTGGPLFRLVAAGGLPGEPSGAIVSPGVPRPNPAPSPDKTQDRGPNKPGPLDGGPNAPGPLDRGPKRPAPVVKKPETPVGPAPMPAPPKPEPVVATPPVVVQAPAGAPAAAPSPPADSPPDSSTSAPDPARDDSGLGPLDTSGLGSPVDETPNPPAAAPG